MAAQACLWMFWLLLTNNMAWKSLERAFGGGAKAILAFYPSFLFLPVFHISFCRFLAELGSSLDHRLKAKEWFYLGWWGHFLASAAWNYTGPCGEERRVGGGCGLGGRRQWLHSLTASLTKRCNVDGSSEAWMKRLCHVSDMFQERKWKSFKFLSRFISECDRQRG